VLPARAGFIAVMSEDKTGMGDHLGMAELGFPVPPLGGDVVLLRPWREADVPGMVLAFSDPVMQRFSWRTAPLTGTDARGWFAELGLARLELTCGPDNEASQHVAGRCGFSREGLLRSHVPFQGARRDSVIYSLLPGELR
jgi:hypothetical protein